MSALRPAIVCTVVAAIVAALLVFPSGAVEVLVGMLVAVVVLLACRLMRIL